MHTRKYKHSLLWIYFVRRCLVSCPSQSKEANLQSSYSLNYRPKTLRRNLHSSFRSLGVFRAQDLDWPLYEDDAKAAWTGSPLSFQPEVRSDPQQKGRMKLKTPQSVNPAMWARPSQVGGQKKTPCSQMPALQEKTKIVRKPEPEAARAREVGKVR